MVTLSETDFTAGRCGLVVSTLAIGARGPRIEPALQTVSVFFLTKFSAIHTFRNKHLLRCICLLSLLPSMGQ